jgi:HK97 family phage prohead protease
MKLNKSYDIAYFKALSAEGEGVFEALVSVFGNVDYQGDRVMSGAFEKTLDEWRKSDKPLPILWSHDWADPFANVGYASPWDVREVAAGEMPQAPLGGLLVKGKFDVDKPFAKQVYDLVREKRVGEWSFSYDTVKEKRASDGANELIELKLIEAGPTLKGANAETMTVGVKAEVEKRLADAAKDQKEYDKFLVLATDVDPTGELTIALMKDCG